MIVQCALSTGYHMTRLFNTCDGTVAMKSHLRIDVREHFMTLPVTACYAELWTLLVSNNALKLPFGVSHMLRIIVC